MKNIFTLLTLTILISSCAGLNDKKPKQVLFASAKETRLAKVAVDAYPPGKTIPAVIDTQSILTPIYVNLYGYCEENEINAPLAAFNDNSNGRIFNVYTDCKAIRDFYLTQNVYILTKSLKSKKLVWVSCNALVFMGNDENEIKVQKEFVSLSKSGDNGEYIFIQKQ